MAFNKRTWKGRQGTGLNKFSIDGATPVTVVNQPDSVTQVGDALSAGNLNDLEDRIEDAFDDVDTALDTKADEQDVTNLNNALSAQNKRIENLEEAHGSYHEVDVKSVYTIPSGKGSNWIVDALRGVSRVENNLVRNGDFTEGSGGTQYWTPYSNTRSSISASDGVLTQTFLTSGGYVYEYGLGQSSVIESSTHKYLIGFYVEASFATALRVEIGGGSSYNTDALTANRKTFVCVVCNAYSYNKNLLIYPLTVSSASGETIKYQQVFIVDLNTYFNTTDLSFLGATDSAKLATIQTNYPWLLTPSDYGTSAVNTVYEGVRSIGVNIWDEVPQIGALYSDGTENNTVTNQLRSDYICVCPSTTYYFLSANNYSTYIRFYDSNKNPIGSSWNYSNIKNTTFTTSADTAYIRFILLYEYGTTYNHDIQICLNSYADKTTYRPYMTHTLTFPTPISLKSAGSVAEEYYPESGRVTHPIGSVDLGTLNWTYSTGSKKFYATLNGQKNIASSDVGNILCSSYLRTSAVNLNDDTYNMCCASINGNEVQVKNLSKTSADLVSGHASWLEGVMLYHELATPSADTYVDPILDNLIATEAGGTIESILTNPVDDSMTLGYINL